MRPDGLVIAVCERRFGTTNRTPPLSGDRFSRWIEELQRARLNRTLSEAVHLIQDEISHDVQLRKIASR